MLQQDTVGAMALPPVRRTVLVPLAPSDAFDLFVRRMAEWWPLLTHSCANEDAASCHVEPGVGGRIVERTKSGELHEWGTMLGWQEPAMLRFTWHPGMPLERATEVEVTFEAEGAGTRVSLEHRLWERFGEEAERVRGRYESGWAHVLGLFEARASARQTTKSSS